MKYLRVVVASCLLLFPFAAYASDGLWTAVNRAERASMAEQQAFGQMYRLDVPTLKQRLSRAGFEGRASINSEIDLPVAGGQIQRFSLQESPIMAAQLAARYPDIKTYKIHGIDNPYASGRLSISPKGFHGMITDPSGTFYIDPQDSGEYRAARKESRMQAPAFNCGVKGHDHQNPLAGLASRPALRSAGSLRVYRLAVAATSEYVAAVGGTRAKAFEEIVTTINRVNQIYGRDLGVLLELIDNDALLYVGAANDDPYSNYNLSAMIDENQQNIDAVIKKENYDIGHVFGTSGGGLAEVGSVCTNSKAGGVTGLSNPTGEIFHIDFVAHEIGHQFSAEHSFNGTEDNCSGTNRIPEAAFEPGSGSTIMSYVGICGAENIGTHADAMFHAGSIDQIDSFTTSGAGSGCGDIRSIDNPSAPTADAGPDYTVPVGTPFRLSASAVDTDTLSYSWDQMDAGTATSAGTHGTDLGDNALMRSRLPQAVNYRYFPRLDSVLDAVSDKAEVLPTTERVLNFRLTVRDGKGSMGLDDVIVSTSAGAGPFAVTSHSVAASLSGNNTQTVVWDVANTSSVPINCTHVDIDLLMLSSDSARYCEESLAVNVDNDGAADVNLPDLTIPKARFRVSCSSNSNIFYALSSADLSVSGRVAADTGCELVIPESEIQGGSIPVIGPVVLPSETIGSSGGGSLSLAWLMTLFSLVLMPKRATPCRLPCK